MTMLRRSLSGSKRLGNIGGSRMDTEGAVSDCWDDMESSQASAQLENIVGRFATETADYGDEEKGSSMNLDSQVMITDPINGGI